MHPLKRSRAVGTKLVLLTIMAGLLSGQEDCMEDAPPAHSRNPLALDCVIWGAHQVYIPIEPVVALDRPFLTAGTGAVADVSMTVRLRSDLFCALFYQGWSLIDLKAAQATMTIAGVSQPVPPEVALQATGLPITAIELGPLCVTPGVEIALDFPTVTTVPWADGAWTVDYLVTLPGIELPLYVTGVPTPEASLIDLCFPTDKSTPPNGSTSDPEDSPRIVADVDRNGTYDVLAEPSHQIQLNVNGYCVGYPCDDGNACTVDHCDFRLRGRCTYTNAPDGTQCDGGNGICQSGDCQILNGPCTGTPGSGLPDDPELCTKTILVALVNNISPGWIRALPYRLTVVPGSPIVANQSFTASVGGAVVFPEGGLDVLEGTISGGVQKIGIVDLVATVQPRGGGATGADVALGLDSTIPFECFLDHTGPGAQRACDPTHDLASVPGVRGNTDCFPVFTRNSCLRIVELPTSTDCAPGGLCDSLGKFEQQCLANGFCVTGDTELPLETVATTYTAGDGVTPGQTEALFGLADDPPPPRAVGVPPIDPDGTWNMLPGIPYTGVAGELGMALYLEGLNTAFEGVMAVESDGPYGVGVEGDYSPTPTP
jgi:hypothetical protein